MFVTIDDFTFNLDHVKSFCSQAEKTLRMWFSSRQMQYYDDGEICFEQNDYCDFDISAQDFLNFLDDHKLRIKFERKNK